MSAAYTHSVSVSAWQISRRMEELKTVTVTATGDWSYVNDDASDSWFTVVEEAGDTSLHVLVCLQMSDICTGIDQARSPCLSTLILERQENNNGQSGC
jgi:hypothetical protein